MDSSKIKAIAVLVAAMGIAVYLGFAAATAQLEAVGWVTGGLFLVICLGLGRNIWMLIPPLVFLQGNVNALPGSPPAWALAAAVVAVMYFLRFSTRRHDFVFRIDWLDFAIFLQLVAVGQAWMRNPTGLLMLGGNTAGGKPYFVFGAVVLAYVCLAITRPSEKSIRWVVYAMVVMGVLDGIVLLLNDYSQHFAQACLRIYGGNIGAAFSGQALDIEETRGGFGMGVLGKNILLPLFCLVPTIRCINPLRIVPFVLTVVGSVFTLISGFRSGVAYFVVLFAAAALARRRLIDVLFAGVLGILAVIVVLGSGHLDKLPFGVQRVLSVVGGASIRVDVRQSAEDSSEDRFEVWRTVLTQKGFIQNKWLGDGFNISAREQTAIMERAIRGVNTQMGLDSFKEMCLATGSYHGFHVETIRFTGVFGLACAIFAMVVFFKCGLRLVRHFRGQPLFGPVLYVCLPTMIYLFWSLLIFGSYRTDFPPVLIMAGVMKMLDNLRLRQLAEENTVAAGKAV